MTYDQLAARRLFHWHQLLPATWLDIDIANQRRSEAFDEGVVQEPGTKQFVIADSRLDFRTGGETRVETTIEVDSMQNPKQFTQKFKDGQVYRSIQVLAGDYLVLCGIRDGGRPSRFSCETDKKGGEFLIVLKRQP
ncbi:MAG: hypothetical protein QGF59_24470 [Pirellulaceae bacterium]|jgi:uncharacterized protein (TIGR03067 family)|nr:hypothetical protein [Planctomycetota bacterium]MDP6721845.1 hypothetical protein [Pirellulaceae bacterium]